MKWTIKIAGLSVQINSSFTFPLDFYEKYLVSDDAVDFTITIDETDILLERDRVIRPEDRNEYSLDKINIEHVSRSIINRKIAEKVISYNTFLIHGAAIATDPNNCYVFIAPSKTGKTTHAKLWLRNLENSFMVNGDKPLIRNINSNYFVCGSPWSGKENMNTNTMVPLKAICVLKRAVSNNIYRVSFSTVFQYLYTQIYKPTNLEATKQSLQLLSDMQDKMDFFIMHVNNY